MTRGRMTRNGWAVVGEGAPVRWKLKEAAN